MRNRPALCKLPHSAPLDIFFRPTTRAALRISAPLNALTICGSVKMYECIFQLGVPRELHASKQRAAPSSEEEEPDVDWGSLSDEIMVHIFARMPIKAAVRASCVCRQWQAIVDSRSFVTFILQFRIPKRRS